MNEEDTTDLCETVYILGYNDFIRSHGKADKVKGESFEITNESIAAYLQGWNFAERLYVASKETRHKGLTL